MGRINSFLKSLLASNVFRIAVVIIALLAGIIIGAYLFSGENPRITDDYWLNLATESIGFIATVLLVNALAARRETNRLKDRLVYEAGSTSNDRAKAAIEDLRHYGWLEGNNGLLRGADLQGANLAGANLRGANLRGAKLLRANLTGADLRGADLADTHLMGANLKGTDLIHANLANAFLVRANLTNALLRTVNLTGAQLGFATLTSASLVGVNLAGGHLGGTNLASANLRGADLTGADLSDTDLTGADLMGASLERADLRRADLKGTNLRSAKLKFADLTDAEFDEQTTMPDSQKWRPDMDLGRFTDPDHDDFYTPLALDDPDLPRAVILI